MFIALCLMAGCGRGLYVSKDEVDVSDITGERLIHEPAVPAAARAAHFRPTLQIIFFRSMTALR